MVSTCVLLAGLSLEGSRKLLQLIGSQVVQSVVEVDLILGDSIYSLAVGDQILHAELAVVQQDLVVSTDLDLSGLFVVNTLHGGSCDTGAHCNDFCDMTLGILGGNLLEDLRVTIVFAA